MDNNEPMHVVQSREEWACCMASLGSYYPTVQNIQIRNTILVNLSKISKQVGIPFSHRAKALSFIFERAVAQDENDGWEDGLNDTKRKLEELH